MSGHIDEATLDAYEATYNATMDAWVAENDRRLGESLCFPWAKRMTWVCRAHMIPWCRCGSFFGKNPESTPPETLKRLQAKYDAVFGSESGVAIMLRERD